MRNAGLEESQAGIKIARRNISNLRYANATTLMAQLRGTKKPLDEDEREKADVKPNIQQTKIMATGPVTSWQIEMGIKWKK